MKNKGMGSKHALLSPSSAGRWLACTPSARLGEKYPDTAGEAAKEGTIAHALGEALIRYEAEIISEETYLEEISEIEQSEYYNADMQELMEEYRDYVMEAFQVAALRTPDAELIIEDKLDLTKWVMNGFGTADAQIIADGTLNIIDLKYGRGVRVGAEGNKQMMLYAIGAVEKAKIFYDIKEVTMTIYQPRLNNISTYALSVDELYRFAEEELKPKAAQAYDGKGDFAVGDHCRFCRAKPRCRAYADEQKKIAQYDFKNAEELSDDEIAEILTKADDVASWLKDVQSYALNVAVNEGKKFKGFKVVMGQSRRRYTNEDDVVSKLLESGFEEALLFEKKLLGITAMEKTITKKKFNTLLGDLVEKPDGKPTLVDETDKRKEWDKTQTAQDDFKNINI
jgi:hypothetical protein